VEKKGLWEALCAQNATRTARVGWSDEFRIGLMGSVRRVLTPRGMKVRQLLELSRDWYWLAVAVVPKSGVLEAQWIGGLSGTELLPVLCDWHDAGIDLLVWDGLPGHRGLQAVVTPMPTILQPAASPELNPTERVGELIRAAVEGRVYTTLWRKMLAVEAVLHELQADRNRVKRLTGYPWILETLKELPWRGSN
jgi:hypothetical protein